MAEHGTRAMYREERCRCGDCRSWNAEQKRRYDARVKAAEGISVTQKYRPGATRYSEHPCAKCGAVVHGASSSPICSPCRSRAKRGIYIRRADRLAIYARDNWTCLLCKEPVDTTAPPTARRAPTLDHIIPRSLGGSDDPDNLRLACRSCNSARGARVS